MYMYAHTHTFTHTHSRAAAVNLERVVQFLLERSPNQPLHNLNTLDTPLLIACRNDNHKIAAMLLSHSPNLLFIQDKCSCHSALHLACTSGNLNILDTILVSFKRIIEKGRKPDDKKISLDFLDDLNRTPLFNACYYGHTNIVERLIEFQNTFSEHVSLNVNSTIKMSQRTPLHVAVKRGSIDIVKILLNTRDIKINPEARPSIDTHKQLIHYIQKCCLGSVKHAQETLDEEQPQVDSLPERLWLVSPSRMISPTTPTSWNKPESYSGIPSSDSPDMSGQCRIDGQHRMPVDNVRSPVSGNERNAFTLPKQYSTPSKSSLSSDKHGRQKVSTDGEHAFSPIRPIRSITEVNGGESLIVVSKSFTRKLEVMPKDTADTKPDYTSFDKLLVTPLIEACVYRQEALVRILLEYGAKDKTGLAYQISSILQKPDQMGLLLSFDCSFVEMRNKPRQGYGRSPLGLQLIWNNKCLPVCHGKWFSEDMIYCPLEHGTNDKPSEPSLSQKPRLYQADSAKITMVTLNTNHLVEVPVELFKLPNVSKINLSQNKLTKLPESSSVTLLSPNTVDMCGWECSRLVELNVSENKLQAIPSCVWLLPNLKHLKAYDNALTTLLPCQGKGECSRLVELNVSRNKLQAIPSCVWLLPNLKHLKASDNALTTLLPSQGKDVDEGLLSPSLLSVDFSNNKLHDVPRFIFTFSTLKQVDLSSNKLETLPETIWACESLQDLDVSSNQLASLPWCEPEASMDVSREAAGTGPASVFKHADKVVQGKAVVESISSRDASFLRQQTSVTTHGGLRPMREMQDLSWSSVATTMTALEGCEYSSLNKLNVAKNNLTYFPEALPCLAPNLSELDVSDNHFDSIDIQFIPQSIKKFTARRCGIERFGNIIDKMLHAVVTHSCRHGKDFGCQHRTHHRLPCLTYLHLTGNKLRYVQLISRKPHDPTVEDCDYAAMESEYIDGVTSLDLLYPVLEGLELTENDLRETFNPNIGYQNQLMCIQLNKNKHLERLPMEFSYLIGNRQFTELLIEDMPGLVEPPKEYQKVGLKHLLTYMRCRLKK